MHREQAEGHVLGFHTATHSHTNHRSLSPQELEQLLSAALEQKLAPIRHMLAEQYNAGPSLRDIIGGLGWLMGLAGLAAYFKSRGPKRGNPS